MTSPSKWEAGSQSGGGGHCEVGEVAASVKERQEIVLRRVTSLLSSLRACPCWKKTLGDTSGEIRIKLMKLGTSMPSHCDPLPEDGGVARSPGPSRKERRSPGSMLFNCCGENNWCTRICVLHQAHWSSITKAAFLSDSYWRWLTHPPISSALSNDGSRVEVQVLQVEVAFDIVREVFVFLSTTIMKG